MPSGGTEHLTVRISVADEKPARADWTSWEDASLDRRAFEGARPQPDDIALIAYTGGTTGRPKGVQHEQHRLALNLLAHIIFGRHSG